MKQRKKAKRRRAHDENRALKRWFTSRGLPLDEVWQESPEDPELENRQLRMLQLWVTEYVVCNDRDEMRRRGFHYPPIEPDCDPDTDWLRFELWIEGKPLSWSYVEEFGALENPEDMSDEEIDLAMREISEKLLSRNVVVMLHEEVPPRLAYAYLKRELERAPFDVMAPNGYTWLDGCSGCCPCCIQRPWCEVGREPGWPEDDRENGIVVPAEVEPYIEGCQYRPIRAA